MTAWERPTVPQPGDVGLTRGKGLVAWAIRWAESRRYGRGSPEAEWNHAFMVVSSLDESHDAVLIEAVSQGVVFGSYHDYDASPMVLLRPPYASEIDRLRAISEMRSMLGEKYGRLTIVSLALVWLTQTRLRFNMRGTAICSGAVSHALDAGGVDTGDDSNWNSPADLLHISRGV